LPRNAVESTIASKGKLTMPGVIAAVPTPINENCLPEIARFLSHCASVLENGCGELNLLGSTGEANAFDIETRKTVMGWVAKNPDRSRLMVGTGALGESTVAGLAALLAVTLKADLPRVLTLDEDARILLLGAEGATDREIHRSLVGRASEDVSS